MLRAVNGQSVFKCSQITKSWMRGLYVEFVRKGINMKKKAENSVEFFFKTVCNTNPAKTIVQKVTKQQSLGLMQYRLYRNSHDEMCRSGTVNTKEPRRRLIFPPTVCVLDFFPQNFHTTNRHLDQPSKLWWKCAVQKRPRRDKSPEAMKIRNRLSGSSTWCIAMFCGEGCGPRETAQITGTSLSHPILQGFH